MAVGCGPTFAKILLIIFNIIFWLSGAALLGIGIWLLVDKSIVAKFDIFAVLGSSGTLLQYAAYVLIVVGAVVLLVGFFGCCGAIKENRCMLGVYIVFLVIIMGAEIAAGVLALIHKDKIETELSEKLGKEFDNVYGGTNKSDIAFTEALNAFQVEFKCCGITAPTDYPPQGRPSTEFPITCCVLKSSASGKGAKDLVKGDAQNYAACAAKTGDYNTAGCLPMLERWIKEKSIILIGVGIGIACLELFGFIFAVCLCRNVGDD